jgi:hypothetical protein
LIRPSPRKPTQTGEPKFEAMLDNLRQRLVGRRPKEQGVSRVELFERIEGACVAHVGPPGGS